MARVGYENVAGFLEGGFKSWIDAGKEFNIMQNITASSFAENFRYNSANVLDVRNPDEWVSGIVAGSQLLPLPKVEAGHSIMDKKKTCYIYCAGGYRSMVAASILMKEGFENVINVLGGMQEIKNTEIALKQLTATTN